MWWMLLGMIFLSKFMNQKSRYDSCFGCLAPITADWERVQLMEAPPPKPRAFPLDPSDRFSTGNFQFQYEKIAARSSMKSIIDCVWRRFVVQFQKRVSANRLDNYIISSWILLWKHFFPFFWCFPYAWISPPPPPLHFELMMLSCRIVTFQEIKRSFRTHWLEIWQQCHLEIRSAKMQIGLFPTDKRPLQWRCP